MPRKAFLNPLHNRMQIQASSRAEPDTVISPETCISPSDKSRQHRDCTLLPRRSIEPTTIEEGVWKHVAAVAMSIGLLATVSTALGATMVQVTRAGAQSSTVASAEYFTGAVRIDSPFEGSGPSRVGGATVTFEPGARAAWHTHPLGQTLIVTAGVGLVQQWDGPVQEIRVGDVIWIPPGVKHWHGGAARTGTTHIAIADSLDGRAVQWMEKVSDAQYSEQL